MQRSQRLPVRRTDLGAADRAAGVRVEPDGVESLASLFDGAAPRLWVAALRRLRDPAAAEELVQDTLVRAWRLRHRFDAGRPLMPWLLGILARLAKRRVAGDADGDDVDLDHVEGDEPDPRQAAQHAELCAAVRAALRRLAAQQRDVVGLWLLWGMSPSDIAAALDRPESTVRVQLHRGLRSLRQRLPRGLALAAIASLVGVRGMAAVRRGTLDRAALVPRSDAVEVPRAGLGPVAAVAGGLALALVGTAVGLAGRRAPDPGNTTVGALAAASDPGGGRSGRPVAASGVTAARAAVQVSGSAVEVRVVWAESGAPAQEIGARLQRLGAQTSLAQRLAVTGADGVARFADVRPGEYWLLVDRGPRRPVRVSSHLVREDVALPAGIDLAAQVRDARGHPLPGAQLWIGDRRAPLRDGQFVTIADAEGRFVLRGLTAENTVSAAAPLHGSPMPRSLERARHGLRLLPAAGRVAGRVVGADGQPLIGAAVRLQPAQETGLFFRGRTVQLALHRQLQTVADGTFDGGWQRRPVLALVTAPDHTPRAVRLHLDPLGAEQSVRLAPGLRVRGRVTDSEGVPLTGVQVLAETWSPLINLDARTDAAGRFELASADPRLTALSIDAPGFARAHHVIADAAATIVDVALELERLPRIDGILELEDGAPAVWWTIQLATPGIAFSRLAPPTRTDGAGRFAFDVPDVDYCLLAYEPGNRTPITIYRKGETAPDAPLRCRVRDGERATAFLSATLFTHDGRPFPLDVIDAYRRGVKPDPVVDYDAATGRLRVGPLAPGRYELLALPDSFATPPLDLGRLRLGAHADRDLGEVRAAAPGTAQLAVRVPEAPGATSPLLLVYNARRRAVAATVNPISAVALAPGDYYLKASGDGLVRMDRYDFSVRAGHTTQVSPTLRAAVSLAVALPDPVPRDWPAPAEATLRLYDPDDLLMGTATVTYRAAAPLTIDLQLPRGRNRLEVTTAQGAVYEGYVTVSDRAGLTETVSVPMTRR
ncbi:MAG: sigma-70 family RNA polymerase sigma factor [Planctomycetota bacterium]